jgi:hypothetical protein
LWSEGREHLVLHGWRNDDFAVKGLEKIDVANKDEVVERACIGDDDHAAAGVFVPRRVRRVAMSCSRSPRS